MVAGRDRGDAKGPGCRNPCSSRRRSRSLSGNYRSGEEHGSARWATPAEVSVFSDRTDPSGNIILTQNVSLAMSRQDHDPRLERNRNVLVIGGSGSGKTRSYVIPSVLQMNSSLLVTDPKGTLEPGDVVKAQGCRLRGARGIPRRGTETRGRDGRGREPETQTTVWSMGDALVAVLAVASALSILAAVGAQDGLLARRTSRTRGRVPSGRPGRTS